MSPLPTLQLMSRKACCLCEEAEAAVLQVVESGSFPAVALEVVDVDHDLELAARYGADVPVLLINGAVKMKHVIRQGELETALMALSKENISC